MTHIGELAFALTEIYDFTIPGSVQYLGGALFAENMSLRHAVFQEGVQSIPAGLFYCYELKSVQIPSSVTSIGAKAFAYCSDDLVLRCQTDSYAEAYAKENGLRYETF